MGELRFTGIERVVDPEVVTQEAEYETLVHPEGREDDEGNSLAGQEYQETIVPELRGAVTFTVKGDGSGFPEGSRAQVDLSLGGGYRAATIVDLPTGEEPAEISLSFGPAPLSEASGLATALALAVDADGNLVGEPAVNGDGLESWPALARLEAR